MPAALIPDPLSDYGVQGAGHAIQTCGPHTGHFVKNIAFCDSDDTAAFLVGRASATSAILRLIGNVDHSQGNGPNAAEMRGQMLNDIREMLS